MKYEVSERNIGSLGSCNRQISYHLYVEYKKIMHMNLFRKQKQTPRLRKQIMIAKEGKWEE